jgi:hypothetical protein
MAFACRCEETHHLALDAICLGLEIKVQKKAIIKAIQKRHHIQEFYGLLEDTKNGL